MLTGGANLQGRYKAEYELLKRPEGSWRICRVTVIGG